jgi:hypothetical protein
MNPHISPALSAIILRSLAKDPQQCFSSAVSMIAAFSEALSQPVSPAGTMNGRVHLFSTESALLPELVSSVAMSSPHVVAQPPPQPQTEQDTTTTKLPLTDAQLQQPAAFALVGDMAFQARYAYAGQTDPITGASQEGCALDL